jgi:chitooligosaccharide deacetylase
MVVRVLLLLLALATPAWAKGWASPAAGESASGDIEVLFTFDDGPNPIYTPQVLDILKEHHIHAVFFLVGDMAGSEDKRVPPIIQRILAEGHVIANHTQKHSDLCRAKTDEKAIWDVDTGKATIEKASGITTAWFRVPYGVRCDRLDKILEERHITHFHWDLDPQEWRHNNVDKTVKYVTGELARAHGRAVLLMHDIHAVTVKALPIILQFIEDENVKRARSHKRKIRILSAPALALEQMPEGFADWVMEATYDLRTLPKSVASVLPTK